MGSQPASTWGSSTPSQPAGFIIDGGQRSVFLPPAVTFEDLGLVIKVTPRVNGAGEVTLDLEAEFKALTGQAFNDIPVIANRKLQTEVRLRHGEWAVVAGLMNASQARTISGLAGLSRVPCWGHCSAGEGATNTKNEVLLILKPALLSLPPSEASTIPWCRGLRPAAANAALSRSY